MEALAQPKQKPVLDVQEGVRYKHAPELARGQIVGGSFFVQGRMYDGERIVQGGQADIYLASYRDVETKNYLPAVLKVQKNMSADNFAEQFAAEAELQKGLSAHTDNVVKFLGGGLDYSLSEGKVYWIGMERMFSSLDRIIHGMRLNKESPDMELVQRMLVPSLGAVATHIHEELDLGHGDLKLSNIMVDENYRGKIGDVGAAATSHKVNKAALRDYDIPVDVVEHPLTESGLSYGTHEFTPPEGLVHGNEIDPKKADYYAAGMVIHLTLGGRLPVEETVFVRGRPRLERPMPDVDSYDKAVPPEAKELVHGLTDPNPDNRLTLGEGVVRLAKI